MDYMKDFELIRSSSSIVVVFIIIFFISSDVGTVSGTDSIWCRNLLVM